MDFFYKCYNCNSEFKSSEIVYKCPTCDKLVLIEVPISKVKKIFEKKNLENATVKVCYLFSVKIRYFLFQNTL